MKTYTGYRLPDDKGTASHALVSVREEGQEPRPLDQRFDLRQHADGFNWSFAGAGPAQLALALAADVLGDDEQARSVYQKLKFRLVSQLPMDGWTLSEEQLRRAIAEIQERGRGRAS